MRVGTSLPTQGVIGWRDSQYLREWGIPAYAGKIVLLAQVSGEGCGIPAYAGECSHTCTRTCHRRLTPAFAGNIQDRKKTPPHQLGRPPRSRGIFLWSNEAAQLRVDPCICREMFAYLHPDTPHKVDPRIRGEYNTRISVLTLYERVTPACAGNIPVVK